jgi:hypothetical protein
VHSTLSSKLECPVHNYGETRNVLDIAEIQITITTRAFEVSCGLYKLFAGDIENWDFMHKMPFELTPAQGSY